MNEKIEKYLACFEQKTRTNGDKFYCLKADAPKELHDSVMEAHGDRMPSDWIYSTYEAILSTLSGYTIDSIGDVEENRSEIVDGLVDVYTSELTAWLNLDNRNVYYLTEAQEEYGKQEDGGKLLAMAQYKAIDEIYESVESLLNQSE